jgi:hypothetical protein
MRSRVSLALAMVLALPALASCGATGSEQPVSTSRPTATSTTPAAEPAAVETLKVACSPTGLSLSAPAVAATTGGVKISVSSTASADTYANFTWEGGGEGNAAPHNATVWTLPAPPGRLRISCSSPTKEWPEQDVRVIDRQGHWRHTTMSDLGCPPGRIPAWDFPSPGRGVTARAAVDKLLASMTWADWSQATATPAPVGYPKAPVQTWIVSLSNRPEISLKVTDAGTMFKAYPDTVCHA